VSDANAEVEKLARRRIDPYHDVRFMTTASL
jgi:hypothetical protein